MFLLHDLDQLMSQLFFRSVQLFMVPHKQQWFEVASSRAWEQREEYTKDPRIPPRRSPEFSVCRRWLEECEGPPQCYRGILLQHPTGKCTMFQLWIIHVNNHTNVICRYVFLVCTFPLEFTTASGPCLEVPSQNWTWSWLNCVMVVPLLVVAAPTTISPVSWKSMHSSKWRLTHSVDTSIWLMRWSHMPPWPCQMLRVVMYWNS